ncbi:MAG: hypothetical protein CO183_00225 [Candidatus Zambryskibacteria bacterium CG_4_9_14_3_um_filter_42_9]|uniref:Uncharacterized protein n=1 Tax=Candidatus Zambryskibacteria bacterium CG22_combo_CG10-13_8_21_14_all_42_17 TaxID=1975118 RepID=A0A2H0BDN7_9BACT|nr:MAG: hypothetical protein COX06_01330 [Candidatus Zambryskibacteria bacterium CG22_combo_CG10-13_8_21_14_all_42_17]PJA37056.1 MAG: hypothetical protein CO183_00225 [Candidatus Zambryskibacteria bacterium CG_4_9_14_3_um_filter_42_9]
MFKLLTEEERQKVSSVYSTRRAIIIFISLIVVLVVGIIGLLPSYVISNARQNEIIEYEKIMANNSRDTGVDEKALNAWLEDINQKLQILSPALDTDSPSAFIDKILGQKISGITITGFSWIRIKDEISLSIDGVATDRQSLVMFENNINSSEYFSMVTLPLSNLAKEKNIDFQIKLSP